MEKNNVITDEMWGLIAKYLNGEATNAEKRAVEEWIADSEENRAEFIQCQAVSEKANQFYQTKNYDENKAFEAIKNRIGLKKENTKTRGRKLYLPFLRYAAAAVLLLSIGITAYYFAFRKDEQGLIVFKTAGREQKTLTLPDGSIVTLNGNTRIVYPSEFLAENRSVEIEGEAFFNVEPNPNKPFIITAENTQIKVLGTSFNVLAYPGAETIEVVVETGKVQVTQNSTGAGNSTEVFLDPGEKATVTKKVKSVQKKTNDDPNYKSWKTGNFVFEKSTLSYVVETLEKSFQVEINFSDPEIEGLRYSAEFENKSIDFILDVIRLTFNLELKSEGTSYYLSSRK
jgi:ferric-dicitrate binding protein FerR (iron transport regulator)